MDETLTLLTGSRVGFFDRLLAYSPNFSSLIALESLIRQNFPLQNFPTYGSYYQVYWVITIPFSPCDISYHTVNVFEVRMASVGYKQLYNELVRANTHASVIKLSLAAFCAVCQDLKSGK